MKITIAQAVKKILRKEPFYGLFLLGLNKYFDKTVSTACVRKNGINVELAINEDYWDNLDEKYRISLLVHECNHLILKHFLMFDYFPNKERFNVATDCEVNSFLWDVHPDWIHPSQFDLPTAKGTKFYYENLPENVEKQFSVFDEHNWKDFKDLSEAEKQLIENQIDYQVKAVVEDIQKSQGNIPGQFKEYIDRLFKKKERIFDWKSYFRRMIGTIQDIELKKTRKRESIRFPDASGLKHKKRSNICVVVDTSGSVSNKELAEFFIEINHVWKSGADITIIENDTTIQNISKYTGTWVGEIHGRGGTAFYECCDWYNEHKKEFNTIIFFTDGYADVDLNIFGPSIWVISSNGKHQKYPGQTLYIPKE